MTGGLSAHDQEDAREAVVGKEQVETTEKKPSHSRRSSKGREKSTDRSPTKGRKGRGKKASSKGSRIGKKSSPKTGRKATEVAADSQKSEEAPHSDAEEIKHSKKKAEDTAEKPSDADDSRPTAAPDSDSGENAGHKEAPTSAAQDAGDQDDCKEVVNAAAVGEPPNADNELSDEKCADESAERKQEPASGENTGEEHASAPQDGGSDDELAPSEEASAEEGKEIAESGPGDSPSGAEDEGEAKCGDDVEPEEKKGEAPEGGKDHAEARDAEVQSEASATPTPDPLPIATALEVSEVKKKKKKKKRMSLMGLLAGGGSPAENSQPVGTDSLDLENALINSGGSMGLGQMKFVGSPKKLQKSVLKKQQQRFNQVDVDLLKSNIVHGWYVDCSCGLRGVNVDDGKKMMQCDVCKAWQHCKCNGLQASTEEQQARLKAKKVWVCQFCKLGRYKYQGHFWKYDRKEEVRKLKEEQAKLEVKAKEVAEAKKVAEEAKTAEEEAKKAEEGDSSDGEEAPPSISMDPGEQAETPAPAGPVAAVQKPGHARSRSVGFSRKVVVHRILSVEESEAARQNAREAVRRSLSVRSILRADPQEFPEAPPIPSPMDMIEAGATPPPLAKKSSISKAISRRLPVFK